MKVQTQRVSAHVIIAIALAVALLGALGFIFWQNFIHKEPVAKESEAIVADKNKGISKENEKPVRSSNWLIYTSQNNKYSVAIPDGWALTSRSGDNNVIAWNSSDIKYNEGEKAKVEVVDGGRDGSSVAFYLLYDYKADEGSYLSPELKKVDSFTTSQGVTVDKSTRTQKSRSSGMDIPYGAQQYTYDFYKGDVRVHIVHDVLVGDKEQTSIIEEVIDTFRFL